MSFVAKIAGDILWVLRSFLRLFLLNKFISSKLSPILVKWDGTFLECIEHQTPDMCLSAVQQNGHSVYFIKEQTPETYLAAVKQDGLALVYVRMRDQTPEICMAAVQQNGCALPFARKQTPELCLAAVTNYPPAIKFVGDEELRQILEIKDPELRDEMLNVYRIIHV